MDTPRQLNLFDWARRAMAAPTKTVNIAISKPLTLQQKHELALAKVAKFTRLAALPDLSPGEAALALTMKRSAIAELKLSQKALDYARPHRIRRSSGSWCCTACFGCRCLRFDSRRSVAARRPASIDAARW
jgi:hypothetical protein